MDVSPANMNLPSGARIHLLGICGTGMAALAGLLHQQGYVVTGSDTQFYPPMGELLKRLGLCTFQGYSAEHLEAAQPHLVIIGNVISRGNEEAQAVMDRGIPFMSFPEALRSFFLLNRTPLVVAGTHGKTTTSSLLVAGLEAAGFVPGFMIGGILREYGVGFRLGEPPWFVLEGDEYDTAFFDKNPKFLHYAPQGLIVTSLEFDHADIYADLNAVKQAFRRLVAIVPSNGVIVACSDWPHLMDVCEAASCPVITYGSDGNMPYFSSQHWALADYAASVEGITFNALLQGKVMHQVRLPMPGMHNALNALSVLALLYALGIPLKDAAAGLALAKGVKRRQEVLAEVNGVLVIDDFAHHPGAVSVTLQALKERYEGRRLLVVFEPRTNTSQRAVFQAAYAEAFDAADLVFVREAPHPEKAPPTDRFSSVKLVSDLNDRGVAAFWGMNAQELLNKLLEQVRPYDVVAVLSNGAFEGIHDRLIAALQERSK